MTSPTLDEIKELCRAATKRGDTEALIQGIRLIEAHHPDTYQVLMVELEKMLNEPGGRLQ